MSKVDSRNDRRITHEMTVLDVIHRYRDTEAVFKKYDEKAGVCICCEALFKTIGEVAEKYGLNLEQILSDLEDAARL
jgi:hypothetical protein